MSSYTGTFSVINHTGQTIDDVSVEHSAADQSPSTLSAKSLGNGDSLTGGYVGAQTSSKDHWTIAYRIGEDLVTAKCTCAFDSDDKGGNVVVALFKNYYNINTPVSSPCTHKSYD